MKIEKIWTAYQQKLRQYLNSRLQNKADVDDLLQEIMIKTHEQIINLESKDKLLPWLYVIAKHSLIDHYRKKGYQTDKQQNDKLWYSEQSEITNDKPEQTLSECIQPFIDQLPDETAALIKATDIEGRSQKELALELGISYSCLKSRVQRGRKVLRKLFESCCLIELDRYGHIIEYSPKEDGCYKNCGN